MLPGLLVEIPSPVPGERHFLLMVMVMSFFDGASVSTDCCTAVASRAAATTTHASQQYKSVLPFNSHGIFNFLRSPRLRTNQPSHCTLCVSSYTSGFPPASMTNPNPYPLNPKPYPLPVHYLICLHSTLRRH